jgi:hypothetical protein
MLKRVLALGIATVALGSLAFVDAANSVALAGVAEPPSREIGMCQYYDDFDTFKDTCVNPAAYGNQLPPNAIDIRCDKVETKWIANRKSIELRLPTSVTSAVGASNTKLHCVDDEQSVSGEQVENATCIEFQQFGYTYSRTIQATCDDVLRFDDAMELCDATLKSAAAWAQVGQPEAIGEPLNSCGAQTQPPEGEQPRPPQATRTQ